jgi:uncharacterized protein YdiU (UPF0061 family)
VEKATAAVTAFGDRFDACWLRQLRAKLGLAGESAEDAGLINRLLEMMQTAGVDFTLTFRRLGDGLTNAAHAATVEEMFAAFAGFDDWRSAWLDRLPGSRDGRTAVAAGMAGVNPLYIPRNHLVEEMIRAAVDKGDYAPFETLNAVLAEPFAERAGLERYTLPATPAERVTRTFCGT